MRIISKRGEYVEGFREIYEKNVNEVYRFLFSLCRDGALAEDLTQETFLRALDRIDSFRGDCKLSVWLCQIAKNLFFQHCKKQKPISPDALSDDLPSEDDPERDVLNSWESSRILQCLHTLDEPYKEVFMLHVFGEVPLKEISLLFEKSDSWARVTFYRAKAAVIAKLKGETP